MKHAGVWDIAEVKEEDVAKPKFVLYTGTEEADEKDKHKKDKHKKDNKDYKKQ